jgi:hypothetical protein
VGSGHRREEPHCFLRGAQLTQLAELLLDNLDLILDGMHAYRCPGVISLSLSCRQGSELCLMQRRQYTLEASNTAIRALSFVVHPENGMRLLCIKALLCLANTLPSKPPKFFLRMELPAAQAVQDAQLCLHCTCIF